MSESTITMNPGAGGEKMDAQLVTQTDGVTQAKREVVTVGGALGGDFVQPATSDPGVNPRSLPVLLVGSSIDEKALRVLALDNEGAIRIAGAKQELEFFDDERHHQHCGSCWDSTDDMWGL